MTNLFLQPVCPLCDRPAPQAFCQDCWRQIQSCQTRLPPTPVADALTVLAWGSYQGSLKQAIAALKYHSHRHLAQPLGRALGEHWQQFPPTRPRTPWVVPIPLHADKLQARGFNQAELIAAAFCQQTGLRLAPQGLIRQRATLPQFGLGAADRARNLVGAFALGPQWQHQRPPAPVLLVDDIYTTGTTVRTAAAVLRRHGISVCGVVAIARTTTDQADQTTGSM